jgi:UrcA family protein
MRVRKTALLAASVLGLSLASAASAQTYGPYGPGYGPPVATVPSDQVIVIAPRYRVDHHSLNTPVENVSLSQPVRSDDLDLRTARGAHELRRRIHFVARSVCGQLIDMYPVGVDSDATCYRNAVAEAMPRADAAIQTARGYPPGLYGGY